MCLRGRGTQPAVTTAPMSARCPSLGTSVAATSHPAPSQPPLLSSQHLRPKRAGPHLPPSHPAGGLREPLLHLTLLPGPGKSDLIGRCWLNKYRVQGPPSPDTCVNAQAGAPITSRQQLPATRTLAWRTPGSGAWAPTVPRAPVLATKSHSSLCPRLSSRHPFRTGDGIQLPGLSHSLSAGVHHHCQLTSARG